MVNRACQSRTQTDLIKELRLFLTQNTSLWARKKNISMVIIYLCIGGMAFIGIVAIYFFIQIQTIFNSLVSAIIATVVFLLGFLGAEELKSTYMNRVRKEIQKVRYYWLGLKEKGESYLVECGVSRNDLLFQKFINWTPKLKNVKNIKDVEHCINLLERKLL